LSLPHRPRWPRPQFSLRLLLAALTTCCVVAAAWFRWPYAETTVPSQKPLFAGDCGTPIYDADCEYSRVTRHWLRQWGGGRVQHGWERKYATAGWLAVRQQYQAGQPHGLYQRLNSAGQVIESGRYHHGRRDGVWTVLRADCSYRMQFSQGRRHGEFVASSRWIKRSLLFENDRLAAIDGEPVAPVPRGDLAVLDRELPPMEFVETPLREVCDVLSEMYTVPISLDREQDPQLPISQSPWPFSQTLGEGLAIIAQTHGLTWRCEGDGICFSSAQSPTSHPTPDRS